MSDNNEIHKIILKQMAAANGVSGNDRLESAWSNTRQLREQGGCGDENLAVAEHYLYARHKVASGGLASYAMMHFLINGYNGIKMVGLKSLLPETGNCKVTGFDAKDGLWSFDGAHDGLKDYFRGSTTAIVLEPPGLRH